MMRKRHESVMSSVMNLDDFNITYFCLIDEMVLVVLLRVTLFV